MAAALTGDDHDEVIDDIFAIADICGFFSSPAKSQDCPRLKLIQSISQLSGCLDAIKTFDETLHSDLRTSLLDLLLGCEEKIRCVRRDAASFIVSITEDRSETVLLEENLCEISGVQCWRGLAWIVFGRSLISSFHRQSIREEELVRELLTKIDDIYMECSREKTEKGDILRITSQCLERDALFGHIQYREGVRLLQQAHDSCQSQLNTDKLGRQPIRLACSQRKTTAGYIPRKRFVGPARTAWEVFQVFQRSSESETVFSCSILVVGDAGSGKTHLCDEMKRSVHPSTIGESI